VASSRSTPSGSHEAVPYSTVTNARRLIDSLDAISVFEVAAVDSGAYARLERRIGGLDPRTDNLVMRIAEGTPYRYPRQCMYHKI
jgi:hypothetical protein